jgi:hypothetical protein
MWLPVRKNRLFLCAPDPAIEEENSPQSQKLAGAKKQRKEAF